MTTSLQPSATPKGGNRRTISVARGLFASLALITLLITFSMWAALYWGSQRGLDREAENALTGAVAETRAALRGVFDPVQEACHLWRDALVESRLEPGAPDTAQAVFSTFMLRRPQAASMYLADDEGRLFALYRDGSVVHTLTGEAEEMQWAHYNAFGEPVNPENWDAEDWASERHDPRESLWYNEAIALCEARKDRNRTGAPDLWYGDARLLTAKRAPSLCAGLAIERKDGSRAVLGVRLRLDALYDLAEDRAAGSARISVVTPQDTVLSSRVSLPSGDAPLGAKGLPRVGQTGVDELPDTYRFWRTATATKGHPYSLEGKWERLWSLGEAFALSDRYPLWIIGLVGEQALRERMWLPDYYVLWVGLAGILLSLSLSSVLARSYTKPIKAFLARVRRIDEFKKPYGYWPNSRLAEVNAFSQACDTLFLEVNKRIEAHSAEGGRQDRAEATYPEVSPHAGKVQRALGPESETAPVAEAKVYVLPQREAPAETQATDAMAEPPAAFIQAMQSTRRQLGNTELRLKALYEEFEGHADQAREQERRLYAQRKTLGMLGRELAAKGDGFDAIVHRITETAARTLNLTAASLWVAEEGGKQLECADHYDVRAQTHTAGRLLRRDEHPVFFIAAESQDIIRVRNATSDPRAPLSATPEAKTAPAAMLITPIHSQGRLHAVVFYEHERGERLWTVDEEIYGLGLAQFLAHCLALGREDTAPAAAEGNARRGLHIPAIEMHEEAPLYRWVLDSAGGIVWALNASGEITYANPAAEEAYGRDAGDMLGRPLSRFVNDGFEQVDRESLRLILGGRESVCYETEHLNARGEAMLLRVRLSLLQDETAAILGAVGLAEDITEARRKERGLREREALYRELVEQAPQVIWAVDAIGCVTSVNALVHDVYGYAPEELLGKPLCVLGGESHGQRDLDRLYKLLGGSPCTGYRTTHRHKDGKTIEVQVFGEVRRDESGTINGALGIVLGGAMEDTVPEE